MKKTMCLIASIFLGIGILGIGSYPSLAAAPSLASSGDEVPPAKPIGASKSLAALPAPTPGETLVYFFPSDNDATATVMYMLNTDSVPHTVALRGYSQNGVTVYSLNIDIGATSMLRLISDLVAASPPPSWAADSNLGTLAPIITNFTDFTYFASLSLPKGVLVDGYVIFNPGTGTVDPRKDQGAIPLRFMTQTGGVFLPLISR